MRLKIALLAVLVAALVVPAALAEDKPPAPTPTADGGGKERKRDEKSGLDKLQCRKQKLLLLGAFLKAGERGFAMEVRRANDGAKLLIGSKIRVLILDRTQVRGLPDGKSLADVPGGTPVLVQAYACKGEGDGPRLVAAQVMFKRGGPESGKPEGAKAEKPEKPERSEKPERPEKPQPPKQEGGGAPKPEQKPGVECGSAVVAGEITNVGMDAFSLRVKDGPQPLVGREVRILVSGDTKIFKGGTASALSDLRVGDRARAEVKACRSGDVVKMLALRVGVESGSPAAVEPK